MTGWIFLPIGVRKSRMSPFPPHSELNDMQDKKIDGINRIDKIVATCVVWLDPEIFPSPNMKVKVSKGVDWDNGFIASGNLFLRDVSTGGIDSSAGLGLTVDEALNDFLTRFVSDARERSLEKTLDENDFEWSDPIEF